MVNLLFPVLKDLVCFIQLFHLLFHQVLLLLALPVVLRLAEDWKKINFPGDFLGVCLSSDLHVGDIQAK